jgi:endonuclease III
MKAGTYLDLKAKVISNGYEKEVAWIESIIPCCSPEVFLDEYIWVVINAGMKEQVAKKIFGKVQEAIGLNIPVLEVFAHVNKAKAITQMLTSYRKVFAEYQQASDKISYLETLPYIGKITKYHLAKNLGVDCVKPDRHLARISKNFGMTPFDMCKKLSDKTGNTLSTVDLVIWRAANLGFI